MIATTLLTVSFLRVYFQGPTTHWGIQCVDFDQRVDRRQSVSFDQTYPVPKLVCASSKRRCYASDAAHAIVARTTIVDGRRIPLRYWPSVDSIPGTDGGRSVSEKVVLLTEVLTSRQRAAATLHVWTFVLQTTTSHLQRSCGVTTLR